MNDKTFQKSTKETLHLHHRRNNGNKIVIITNTVPLPQLIHDSDTRDSVRFNLLGNSLINQCILNDERNLIDTWCFGHYQNPVDEIINGIRFVSNPRHNIEDAWDKLPYNPKKIIIDS